MLDTQGERRVLLVEESANVSCMYALEIEKRILPRA